MIIVTIYSFGITELEEFIDYLSSPQLT